MRDAARRHEEREHPATQATIEEDTSMERATTSATRPDPHDGVTVVVSRRDQSGLRSSLRNKHADTKRHGLVLEQHENRAFNKDDGR